MASIFDDPKIQPFRSLVREHRYSGAEWAQGNGVTAETELVRALVGGRELICSGKLHYEVNGQMLVSSGSSGTLTLKLYAYNTADNPVVALASATLMFTHTVTIADPAGGAGLGDFTWELELIPLGDSDTSNKQTVRSTIEYRRHSTDTPIVDRQRAQLTTLNLRSNTILIPTSQKSAGWSTGRFNPYSIDAWIIHGRQFFV